MGMTDNYLIPKMPQYIADRINKLSSGSRVAWLGQKHPDMKDTDGMYKGIMNLVEVQDLHHDFYDIDNDENIASNSFAWDVNTEWNFENYDLIVAVRIFYACESASQLLKNIKKMVSSGQEMVGDLMSGNTGGYVELPEPGVYRKYYINMHGDYEVFKKPKDSKSIIPVLMDMWIDWEIKNPANEYKFGASVTHDDQLLTEEMFAENEISLVPLSVFREPKKRRIYAICEFSNGKV